uniref:Pleckstrin homology domain containing, family A member 6 n=1 Tax=Sparus aurata TaxID=8175 RepID=A0A671TSQ7_SPAAU
MSSTPRKLVTFGKRSNSMRRNPKAEVTKQGWLYKQASSGVRQWNKRWFVLTDRSLFYYKDEKEDTVLGSLPLLSFQIGGVEPLDNITRKFAFKAEHTGTKTYYFSTDSHEDQEEWIRAMSEASEVNIQPKQRCKHKDMYRTPSPFPPLSNQVKKYNAGRRKEGDDDVGGPVPDNVARPNHHPNDGNYDPCETTPLYPPSRSQSRHRATQEHPQRDASPSNNSKEGQQENVVLRRGFVPRTAPERVAQRKSSMAQLQQWVNQRRGMASQEDLNSPSSFYPVSHGVSADYYGYPGGPQYVEEYPLYLPGVRPDSICSVSAVGAYDRPWIVDEKRHSLRDEHYQFYGPPMPRDQWRQQYYYGMETSMKHLSIKPRSRSVPRSPSSSSGGLFSPVPHNFSPVRSPSVCFDRYPARMRDDVVYADPSVYSLRRSPSSSKYEYHGNRRSLSQGLYSNYPRSPSIHNNMVCVAHVLIRIHLQYNIFVPPFHDVYSRELHPTLKLNEIETSKLLGRLCEQNRLLKDHEAVVHRLRMGKDSLEEALVATHQEMDLYHNQPLAMEKLQFTKETLQNQLINIRGELSRASSALTTTRMEFETLEDEASAIHGDLWEQLNAGGQRELVRRHIQKEFWRVQDVLEGLHKNNSSRGTDTGKNRVASGASGSFSTNSPASPMSSVSLTSPLSPFSPVPGSQASPTKQPAQEVSTQLGANPNSKPVGIVPPRTKSPTDESHSSSIGVSWYNAGVTRERPKSAVFTAEVKSKMSVQEQNDRIRRNQSSSVRDKRRSLTLSSGQSPIVSAFSCIYLSHEIDIKHLEAAVRGQGQESPREEIARLRRSQVEPVHYDLDISKELMAPDKVVIPECHLDLGDDTPLSPEEQKEKQKKLERIKTLIAKSNLQNIVPLLDGPVEGGTPVSSQQQLQEQEKRIEISCALAAEASRRSRLLSVQCASSPPNSPTSLVPPHCSADFTTPLIS